MNLSIYNYNLKICGVIAAGAVVLNEATGAITKEIFDRKATIEVVRAVALKLGKDWPTKEWSCVKQKDRIHMKRVEGRRSFSFWALERGKETAPIIGRLAVIGGVGFTAYKAKESFIPGYKERKQRKQMNDLIKSGDEKGLKEFTKNVDIEKMMKASYENDNYSELDNL